MNDNRLERKIKDQLELLGIYECNTKPNLYRYYTNLAMNRLAHIPESSQGIDMDKAIERHCLLFNKVAYVMHNPVPFTAEKLKVPVLVGHKRVHPVSRLMNMNIFRNKDDIQMPFVSDITTTFEKTENGLCWTHVVSIEHHIEELCGKEEPLGWWTEMIAIVYDQDDIDLLQKNVEYTGDADRWDMLKKQLHAAHNLKLAAAKEREELTQAYCEKCEFLYQALIWHYTGTQDIRNFIPLFVFRRPEDIDYPVLTKVVAGIDNRHTMFVFRHTIDAPQGINQYLEVFYVDHEPQLAMKTYQFA